LGTVAEVTHEVLFVGVDLLDLAPVPGLKLAAQLLLNIWDASQLVDVSFMPLSNHRHNFS
jgi:abelson tyrosine-protein kinase 1